MPHTSKKAKKTAKSSNKLTYIVVAVIIAIVAGAVAFYSYSSLKSTTTSTTTASTIACPVSECAVIVTTQGTMEAALFPSVAPKTVANFVSLADSGFYTDLVWHRIVAGFVIQTGDPTTKNGGGVEADWGDTSATTTVPLETNSTTVKEGYVNNVGYLGLARGSSNDSGSSQFYINLGNNTSLNGLYTVFGKLITGLSVAQAIGKLPVNADCASSGDADCQPLEPTNAEVLSITIITNSTS